MVSFTSCANRQADGGEPEIPTVLYAVPSDAVSVAYFSSCSECLKQMVDSSDALSKLPLGELGSHPAVLSYCYAAGLVPLLSLDLKDVPETSECVRALHSSGLESRTVNVKDGKILLMSRSRAIIKETADHVVSGTSILSSNGFEEVFEGADAVYVRNSTIIPLLRTEYGDDFPTRKKLADFLPKAAQWMVLKRIAKNYFEIKPNCSEDASYAANIFKDLEPGDVCFPLRDSADRCVALAMKDWSQYNECFESWMYSRNKQASSRKQKAWARQFCPLEVVRFEWAGREVVLARSGGKLDDFEARENPDTTYLASLFGGAFKLKDETCCAARGGWLAVGSPESVDAYLKIEPGQVEPLRGVSLYLRDAGHGALCIEKRIMTLKVY